MDNFQFTLNFTVRDYECDLQGVVNNAIYLHYLEHTRHEFLKQIGVDFADLVKKNIFLVVIRSEVDYLASLTSGDSFVVGLDMHRLSPTKFVFHQEIHHSVTKKVILKAQITGTALNEKKRPELAALDTYLAPHVMKQPDTSTSA